MSPSNAAMLVMAAGVPSSSGNNVLLVGRLRFGVDDGNGDGDGVEKSKILWSSVVDTKLDSFMLAKLVLAMLF